MGKCSRNNGKSVAGRPRCGVRGNAEGIFWSAIREYVVPRSRCKRVFQAAARGPDVIMEGILPSKTHCTAVAVVPPPEVWGPIQDIRRRHDRRFRRWMPHVNLLYPFVTEFWFPRVLPALRQAAEEVDPFEVILAEIRWFEHKSGWNTLWLDPHPTDALKRLHERLRRAVPVCDDLARFPGGFHPHLSIGQIRRRQRDELIARLQADWTPLRFVVSDAAVLIRGKRPPDDVFRIHQRLVLGKAYGDPKEVNV